ncbi:MAG: glutamine synthetase [Bacteroidetes bacterium]|nr:glutamine synthetase [Rhodothermaceae bacterium RA]RMH60671.1 MAG: glutamine synthetase [Bacteroidota bacterium]
MTGMLDLDTLKQLVGDGDIDTVLVCMVDMQGRLIGKRVTGWYFLEHVIHEMHVCNYLLTVDMAMEPVPGYAAASWDLGYGDIAIRPDLGTLRLIPWLPGTALVLGDCCDHHGNDLPHAPRSILKRQIDRLAERGMMAKMASELEFYVLDESYEAARAKDYKDLKTAGWYIEDYHIFQTTKEEPLIRAIRNGMDGAGIPVEFSKGEWGPGQEEINLRYAEALEMADRHSIYKNGVKEIAYLHGKAVTFMAKWRYDLAGSSCHIHSSLWDVRTGRPLFYDADAADGMSRTMRHYLAGQLALAREMTYFLAPYINSYKRFQAGSFAPTRAVWSLDNRTAGFRVIGSGPGLRVECRIPGADVNPYLAYAATLAAGLYGIEHELELEPAFTGNAYAADAIREVPKTLREALAELDGSEVLRAAFGDAVIDHYLRAGRWEQEEYDRRITDWERRRFFEQA